MVCVNDFTAGSIGSQRKFDEDIIAFDSMADTVKYQTDVLSRVDIEKAKYITSFFNRVLAVNSVRVEYPFIQERITSLGDLTVAEIAGFVVDRNYNIDNLISVLLNDLPRVNTTDIYAPNADTKMILSSLDDYLSSNISASVTGSFCGALTNVFAKLSQIQETVRLIKTKIDELENLSNKSDKEILNAVKSQAHNVIDKMAGRLLDQVSNGLSALESIKGAPSDIIRNGIDKVNKINVFFSEENITALKNKVETVVAQMASQFEKLDADSLAFVLFRMCQIMESVERLFKSPLQEFQNMITNAQNVMNTVNTSYNYDRAATRSNGGFSLNRQQVDDLKTTAYKNQAGGKGQPPRAGGGVSYTKPVVSDPDNRTYIQSNTFDVKKSGGRYVSVSNEYARLTERAMNVGVDYNKLGRKPDTCGWTEVSKEVWARLAVLSKRMGGVQFVVSSAYRTPEKNGSLKGAAKSSFHMRGMALDIYGGSYNKAEFIKQANLSGFGGIGYYPTFIHIDIRKELTIWNQNNAPSDIREAMNIHRFPEKYGFFKDNFKSQTPPSIGPIEAPISTDKIDNILIEKYGAQ